jgi:hypothetical protein
MDDVQTLIESSDSGKLDVKGEFSITVRGLSSRESALSTILDMLEPRAKVAAAMIASSGDGKALQESTAGVYTLKGYICCNFHTGTYSWCPGNPNDSPQMCTVKGNGCPS